MALTQGILVGTLKADERNGIAQSVTMRYLVTGLTYSTPAIIDEAMAATGIPSAGAQLATHPQLVVTSRSFEAIDGNLSKGYIDITYERYGRDNNYQIDSGTYQWNLRLLGGLQQVETNNDIYGNEITVSHTWPAEDDTYGGDTLTQGATVAITEAQPMIEITGMMQIDYPMLLKLNWENYVNSDTWAGLAPRVWLCQSFEFTLSDPSASPYLWEFTAQFQANINGWDQIAYYTDPRTGKPPPNLVADTGYVRPETYFSRPFNELFPL